MYRLLVLASFILPLAMWNGFGAGYELPKWSTGFLFATIYLVGPKPRLFCLTHFRFKWSKPSPFTPLFLLFLLHCGLIVTSLNPGTALIVCGCLLVALVFYMAGASEFSSFQKQHSWVTGLCISGFIVSLYGILQVNGIDPLGFGYYDPISTFGHRNFAAQFLIILIPMAVWLARMGNNSRIKLLGAITALLAMLHLLATTCRGAWLGFVASILVAAVLLYQHRYRVNRRTLLILFIIVSILIVTFLSLPILRQRLISIGDLFQGSNYFRILVWKSTLNMIQDYPIAGIGPGQFGIWYPRYRLAAERELSGADVFVQRAHNDYLHTVAETGLPGLALLILTGAFLIIALIRNLKQSDTPRATFVIAASAAITATCVHALVSMNWRNPVPLLLCSVLIGACCHGTDKASSHSDTPSLSKWSQVVSIGVAAILLFGLCVFGVSDHLIARARIADQARNDQQAANRYLEAAEFWPWSVDAYYQAGFHLIMAGNPQQAQKNLEKALTLSPWFTNAIFNLAIAHEETRQIDEAMTQYQRVLELDPLHEDSQLNLGYLQVQTGQPEQAEETFTRLLSQNPYSADCWNNLGIVRVQTGRIINAEQAFRTAQTARRQLRFDSSTVRHFALFGAIDVRSAIVLANGQELPLDQWTTVEFSARSGSSPVVQSPSPRLNIDWKPDSQDLVLTFQPHTRAVGYRLQYRIRNHEDETYLNVSEPLDSDIWNNLGYCLELQGQVTNARTCYKTAVAINPAHPNATRNLARLGN